MKFILDTNIYDKLATSWRTCFMKFHSKPELIGIAGIHATLLAIIVASLSVYTLFISENVQTLQQRAIKEAGKINEIEFYRYSHGTVKQEEVWDKEKMVKMLYKILWGDDDPSVKESEREYKALGIMNAIMCQHPFCNRHFKTEDGRFGSRGDPEPIIFEDFKSVLSWVNEIDVITLPLISVWDERQDYIISLFDKYSKKEHVKVNIENCFEPTENERFFAKDLFSKIFCDPVSSCKDFFSKLIEARKIMKEAKYYIQQTHSYKDKVIPVKTLIFIFIMICLVFIFGVIFPLSLPSVSTIWLLWVPFILYGLGYFYLVFSILKFTMG